jgi:hypothetical protein
MAESRSDAREPDPQAPVCKNARCFGPERLQTDLIGFSN